MGDAGTDAAIEAADVALMGDDPGKVLAIPGLGRERAGDRPRTSCLSILLLAALIPAAVSGLLGITVAVFAHEASELLAVANGLRVARGQAGR
ncbi:MAG: hypothetical protein KatS3mg108_0647 [Isosphaeraceae bacterium]|nr:MAG: hypothetical protein KatS3mg108_0647 [Isosphaeraceae bacterium]